MSNDLEPLPFNAAPLIENPEPRCACVLLLDTSGSMSGQPITQLNEGLQQLREELNADRLAASRVEMAVVTFGPVTVHNDFTTVSGFYPPTLHASGDTPMGNAIETAIEMLRARKKEYQQVGVAYYRPWIFLITDGSPTDAWSNAAEMVRRGEDKKEFLFFAVGVDQADTETLKKICHPNRVPLKLRGMAFRELFAWLSNSLSSVSRSRPDEEAPLTDPTGPKGWGSTA
jgi:uncharacterized protein YegL